MKIATFNINNVNRRLPNLLRWLRAAKPDVVCLQELKATDEEFPRGPIEKAGFHAVRRGQKTWNGVAILSRKAEPVLIRDALPGDRSDHEARKNRQRELGGVGSRLRWRRSRRFCNGVAAFVDARVAVPEAGQHLIADGAEMMRELVDGDAFADQRHHVATPGRIRRHICDVDRDHLRPL